MRRFRAIGPAGLHRSLQPFAGFVKPVGAIKAATRGNGRVDGVGRLWEGLHQPGIDLAGVREFLLRRGAKGLARRRVLGDN